LLKLENSEWCFSPEVAEVGFLFCFSAGRPYLERWCKSKHLLHKQFPGTTDPRDLGPSIFTQGGRTLRAYSRTSVQGTWMVCKATSCLTSSLTPPSSTFPSLLKPPSVIVEEEWEDGSWIKSRRARSIHGLKEINPRDYKWELN